MFASRCFTTTPSLCCSLEVRMDLGFLTPDGAYFAVTELTPTARLHSQSEVQVFRHGTIIYMLT